MIDWATVITGIVGASITGSVVMVGSVIKGKVVELIDKIEQFSVHILQCEERNKAHDDMHRMSKEATDQRLDKLERLSHRKREGEKDD